MTARAGDREAGAPADDAAARGAGAGDGDEGGGRSLSSKERHRLALLGLPTLGLALAITVVSTYAPTVAHRFTTSNTVIGVLVGVGGRGALLLPVPIGAWSDRLRTRWGGRLPFVAAGDRRWRCSGWWARLRRLAGSRRSRSSCSSLPTSSPTSPTAPSTPISCPTRWRPGAEHPGAVPRGGHRPGAARRRAAAVDRAHRAVRRRRPAPGGRDPALRSGPPTRVPTASARRAATTASPTRYARSRAPCATTPRCGRSSSPTRCGSGARRAEDVRDPVAHRAGWGAGRAARRGSSERSGLFILLGALAGSWPTASGRARRWRAGR